MSERIECRAYRRDGAWVARVPEHGVYGYGRTLKAVGDSISDGLAHIGVTAQVTVIAVTPELENLRAVQDTYTTALRAAVTALALRSTTLGDIAQATGAPTTRVKALLADRSAPPANLDSPLPTGHTAESPTR
ncbi:hypothetical protein APR12_005607 [Nocardia amikacinitolerans]|uniref:hypothetical protein n=1 Tax=Nocardia amikacinitolerans TaxID=756689 RepID=UPI0008309CE4|nr:hypothetical protein [Nocardia amikacinitolerans]MCP2320226.1 hypothetical protein [Nocardia amikacinitolerans]